MLTTDGGTLQRFTGERDAAEALRTVIANARRYLDVQSIALDHDLFDTVAVETLVSELSRRHAASRIRILVDDVGPLVERGHRLVELARRLPSKVEIRRANEPASPRETTFVVADNVALWQLQDRDVYAGFSITRDPIRAERLTIEFARRFEGASSDPELRLLSI